MKKSGSESDAIIPMMTTAPSIAQFTGAGPSGLTANTGGIIGWVVDIGAKAWSGVAVGIGVAVKFGVVVDLGVGVAIG